MYFTRILFTFWVEINGDKTVGSVVFVTTLRKILCDTNDTVQKVMFMFTFKRILIEIIQKNKNSSL